MSVTALSAPASVTRTRSALRPRKSPVLTIILWMLLAYFMLPLCWLLVNATKSNVDLFGTFGLAFAPSFALFDNIGQLFAFQDGIYLRWFANTVLYAVVGAGGAALISAMGGYALAKFDFHGRKAVLAIVLGATAVPGTALAVPFQKLFPPLAQLPPPSCTPAVAVSASQVSVAPLAEPMASTTARHFRSGRHGDGIGYNFMRK